MTLAALPISLASCTSKAEDMPVPAVLQQPAELPYGDRQLAAITRSTTAALDLLEPRFGKLGTRPYVVDAGATGTLRQQLAQGLPEGWQKLDLALPPERGELIAYAAGKEVFAVLLPPVVGETVLPVTVLSNRE